jgi:hypothetical protein
MGGDLVFVPTDGWTAFRLELPTAAPPRTEGFGSPGDSASVGSIPDGVVVRSVVSDDDRPATIDDPPARVAGVESAVPTEH